MKTSTIKLKQDTFEPFVLQIEFEAQEELDAFKQMTADPNMTVASLNAEGILADDHTPMLRAILSALADEITKV